LRLAGAAGWAALLALTAAAFAGCDQCEYGAVICRDNAILTCTSTSAPLRWMVNADCGPRLCRLARSSTGAPAGVCSVEEQPNPACGASNGSVCAGGRVVTCDLGYVVAVDDTCARVDLCITKDMPGVSQRLAMPFCAVSTTPDPRCPADPPGDTEVFVTPHCAAGHLIKCALGLLSSETDCGAEELCYTPSHTDPTDFPQATCVASRTPDPRCPAGMPSTPFERRALVCDGDRLLTCVDALLASTQDCGPAGCEHPPENAAADCRMAITAR
jgi:hypothetical protein